MEFQRKVEGENRKLGIINVQTVCKAMGLDEFSQGVTMKKEAGSNTETNSGVREYEGNQQRKMEKKWAGQAEKNMGMNGGLEITHRKVLPKRKEQLSMLPTGPES